MGFLVSARIRLSSGTFCAFPLFVGCGCGFGVTPGVHCLYTVEPMNLKAVIHATTTTTSTTHLQGFGTFEDSTDCLVLAREVLGLGADYMFDGTRSLWNPSRVELRVVPLCEAQPRSLE